MNENAHLYSRVYMNGPSPIASLNKLNTPQHFCIFSCISHVHMFMFQIFVRGECRVRSMTTQTATARPTGNVEAAVRPFYISPLH